MSGALWKQLDEPLKAQYKALADRYNETRRAGGDHN